MPNDPFIIIGVDPSASQPEILEAYKARRQALSQKVFAEGEEGADAARKIEELDTAYQLAMELKEKQSRIEQNQTFEDVKDAIKNKDIERAQRFLDAMEYRSAEWHYYQAIVFYSKHWLSESKKQLQIALELDPTNPKYRKALDNLEDKTSDKSNSKTEQSSRTYGNGGTFTNTANSNGSNRTYQPQDRSDDVGRSICDACTALWCADCCCECMGGDLIACC